MYAEHRTFDLDNADLPLSERNACLVRTKWIATKQQSMFRGSFSEPTHSVSAWMLEFEHTASISNNDCIALGHLPRQHNEKGFLIGCVDAAIKATVLSAIMSQIQHNNASHVKISVFSMSLHK